MTKFYYRCEYRQRKLRQNDEEKDRKHDSYDIGKWKEHYTIQRELPGIHNDPNECEMKSWEWLLLSYGSGGS
jgi:hypothetical protein